MMKCPQKLEKGDLISIIAPAKAIEKDLIFHAKSMLENYGFRVIIGEHCTGRYNYFSGNIHERLSDFQTAIDNLEVRAILCARGGYGSIQIVDKLNWDSFSKKPKWIIGFSDITVFHQKLASMNYCSIHGTMPLDFKKNSEASLTTLVDLLFGSLNDISFDYDDHNIIGSADGVLSGGNLSILYGSLGTDDQPDYSNNILFIEDLAEHLYHIDRIFHAFNKAGILRKLNGIIVGGMTNLMDTAEPFGMDYKEIIEHHCEKHGIPVAFGFPAGHIDDNRSIMFGRMVRLSVSKEGSLLEYL